jgi:hypothetical protein
MHRRVGGRKKFRTAAKSHLLRNASGIHLCDPDCRSILCIVAGTPISRAMVLGPAVPLKRVAALRQAFDALMKDTEFRADAQKRKLNIHPRGAEEIQALVAKIVGASPELVVRVKKAIGMDVEARL